jgi:vacuolar-type H+-ATPase subunit H
MNKIMSIDKDAQNYRKNIDELLIEKQNVLDNIINDLMARFEEECKNIKQDIGNRKMLEAENIANNIRKEKEEELTSINAKYQANKLELVEVVFNRVIKLL